MNARTSLRVALIFGSAVVPGGLSAQEILFKNIMNSPITVVLRADEMTSPAEFELDIEQEYQYTPKYKGLYTIQIIPHDQPDSGNHLGPYDLQSLSKKLAGKPFPLRGEFDEDKVRIAVFVDLPHPVIEGWIRRMIAPRVDYKPEMPAGSRRRYPDRTTAVIAASVPGKSLVTIDGKPTTSQGELRFFVIERLTPGTKYYYTMKVEWTDKAGHECVETRKVIFEAGKTTHTFFKMPIEASAPLRSVDLVPIKILSP